MLFKKIGEFFCGWGIFLNSGKYFGEIFGEILEIQIG